MFNSFEELRKKADSVRNIDLATVLQHQGCTKDPLDKAKWHTARGVISVNNQKFMNWTLGTGGGCAIDLVIHLQNVRFKEAVSWLCDNFPHPCPPTNCREKRTLSKNRVLKLPQKDDSKLYRVRYYLRVKRRIPQKLIDDLIDSKKLYADIRANAVFLLLGKNKKVVGAELRGTSKKKWHNMAQGSQKSLGCFYIVGASNRKLALCESAIDAMSFMAIHPEYSAISTSGATTCPCWLQGLITNGCEIYCAFDADNTGDMFAEKMMRLYPTIKRLRPTSHDWNKALQNLFR